MVRLYTRTVWGCKLALAFRACKPPGPGQPVQRVRALAAPNHPGQVPHELQRLHQPRDELGVAVVKVVLQNGQAHLLALATHHQGHPSFVVGRRPFFVPGEPHCGTSALGAGRGIQVIQKFTELGIRAATHDCTTRWQAWQK